LNRVAFSRPAMAALRRWSARRFAEIAMRRGIDARKAGAEIDTVEISMIWSLVKRCSARGPAGSPALWARLRSGVRKTFWRLLGNGAVRPDDMAAADWRTQRAELNDDAEMAKRRSSVAITAFGKRATSPKAGLAKRRRTSEAAVGSEDRGARAPLRSVSCCGVGQGEGKIAEDDRR
jgi:hypothetical protein